jgi:hypothetical protein
MTINLQRRMLYIPVLHIDTNVTNARQKLSAMNRLEKWYADEVILINMAGAAQGEALAGTSAQRTRKALMDPAKLRQEAIDYIRDHPLQSLHDAQMFDAAGRKVGTRPAASPTNPQLQEAAVRGFMEHLARLHRTPLSAATSHRHFARSWTNTMSTRQPWRR